MSSDIKAFLDYVDAGIVSGKFVEELNAAVENVKFNENVRLNFMTLQMALLESRLTGKIEGEIQKATDLPIQRIEELAKKEATANHA